jgi:tripartite-type tricarboxylate transporter receptor subunit TctC
MRSAVRKSDYETPRRRSALSGHERRLVTQHPRRRILSLAAGAAALPAMSRMAWAQAYPTRPVRIIVGFPAGGAQDIVARLIGQWLQGRLGQPFIIENRPGANGNIGAQAAANALADGYTLLLVGVNNALNAAIQDKPNFHPIRDIAPVSPISRTPLVMAINPTVPAATVPEFIAYAKANPDKINVASAGNGSVQHVAGELFKMMTGIEMSHVPYRGDAPAFTALIGGQVHILFGALSASIEQIRAGKIRGLAVTTSSRSIALPDIPTVSEFVPGYEASGWNGVGAPTGTASAIIEKLNKEITAALSAPEIQARLDALGIPVMTGSPADFGKLIADDTDKWARVVKFAGIKAE